MFRTGKVEILKLLLENGANVNIRGGYNRRPLYYAVEGGKSFNYFIIFHYISLLASWWFVQTCVFVKLKSFAGKLEVVKVLLEAEAKVDVKDDYGSTPLAKAAEIGKFQLLRFQ